MHACSASGNGGQTARVVPELGPAVLTFAGNYIDGATRSRWRYEPHGEWILPAALAPR